jgi:hypothetical protein
MDRKGVIVRLPVGFDPNSETLRALDAPPLYGELAKSIPGIPQGSLVQYRELLEPMATLGFVRAQADPCLFVHSRLDMNISVHVDDFVLMCDGDVSAAAVFGANGLGKKRKIKWGPLTRSLGIDFSVVYDEQCRHIFMSQRPYAAAIIERAGMQECAPVATPAVAGRKYTKADCAITKAEVHKLRAMGLTEELYATLNASLRYLVLTRLDLLFALGKTSKFNHNPGMEHWQALKHVLRFLNGTLDYGIEFVWRAGDKPKLDGPLLIEAYSDSSFADDVDTARTTIGHLLKVNNATVAATSRLTTRVDACVNHSELEALVAVVDGQVELKNEGDVQDGACLALLMTGRSLVWARGVKAALERRDVGLMPPTTVFVDNTGVLSMV